MRRAFAASVLAMPVIATLLAGCDVVNEHYDTIADARAAGLFGRGWLPDVLPASAVDIHTANNLDLDTSTGRLAYRVGDDEAMFAAMVPGAVATAPFARWADIVEARREDGMQAWTYGEDFESWVFFCDRAAGRCETWAWTDRARRRFVAGSGRTSTAMRE